MRATVGRIVHFYQEAHADRGDDVQPLAAIVTQVHGDGSANLHVFHAGEGASPNGKALRVREGDPASDRRGRLWCWPPREPHPTEDSSSAAQPDLAAASHSSEPLIGEPADAGVVPPDEVTTEGDGHAPAEST